MKRHFNDPTYGVTCNTNKSRLTTHRARLTKRPSEVTCERCKARIAGMRPEYIAKCEAAADTL